MFYKLAILALILSIAPASAQVVFDNGGRSAVIVRDGEINRIRIERDNDYRTLRHRDGLHLYGRNDNDGRVTLMDNVNSICSGLRQRKYERCMRDVIEERQNLVEKYQR